MNKFWEECDLLNNFYQILQSLNELLKFNLCHGNISLNSIAFSYRHQSYKLINLNTAVSYFKDHKKAYPVISEVPFLAPELR